MRRTPQSTVKISPETHEVLRLAAALFRVSQGEVVERALAAYLHDRERSLALRLVKLQATLGVDAVVPTNDYTGLVDLLAETTEDERTVWFAEIEMATNVDGDSSWNLESFWRNDPSLPLARVWIEAGWDLVSTNIARGNITLRRRRPAGE